MHWRSTFLIVAVIYFAGLASDSEHLGGRCFAQEKAASETEIPSARRIIERYIAAVGGQMELDLPEHMRIDFRVEDAEGSAVSATEQFVQAGDRWRTTMMYNVVGWQYGMDAVVPGINKPATQQFGETINATGGKKKFIISVWQPQISGLGNYLVSRSSRRKCWETNWPIGLYSIREISNSNKVLLSDGLM